MKYLIFLVKNMNHPDNIPPLEDMDAMIAHLETSLDAKKLNVPQKIQVLRDLMGSGLGANQMFYDACQYIISALHRTSFDLPTAAIQNARFLLAHPTVLSQLQSNSLQSVVGGDIAFRVNCIEELRRIGRTDILLQQVGRLGHWKEGQAMIHALLSTGTTEQLFQVLMRFIQGKFSHRGEYSFGPDIYREESIDALVSAVISRATIPMLSQISIEFEKGAAIGLPPEQFARYASSVAVIFTASQIRHEFSDLIDTTRSSVAHPESSAFWVPSVPAFQHDTPLSDVVLPVHPSVQPSSPPTKIDRPSIPSFKPVLLPPRHQPANEAPHSRIDTPPLPPRGLYANDESEGFSLLPDDDISDV